MPLDSLLRSYRLNTVTGHAIGYHVVANRVGTALAQGKVVLSGTPLIGMPFKTNAVIAVSVARCAHQPVHAPHQSAKSCQKQSRTQCQHWRSRPELALCLCLSLLSSLAPAALCSLLRRR